MSRRLLNSKQLLALVLPLALFLSWAACLVLCEENAAHRDDSSHAAVIQSGSDCFDLNVEPESCPTTADAVILQERQTIKETTFATVSLPALMFRAAFQAQTFRLPEIKQNSPPEISSKPLFVRFGVFRI